MDDELRLRTRMIGAGLWLSVVLLSATGAWIAESWHRPHRGGLVVMSAGATLITAVIALFPRERIVMSRCREPFFLGWSLSLIAFIATAAALDAGVRSPIVLMLFLTLVYAALSYPRRSVAVVSLASLVAVLVVSTIRPADAAPAGGVYLTGLMLTLAATGVMCIIQARIQEEAHSELQRISRRDPLTGALNRLGFGERMTAELRRAAHDGDSVALVVLDFDGFKLINDRLGHPAGDELLRWSVNAMTSALRPGDALARLGGDEFAALLPRTATTQAERAADRLRLALSERIVACAGIAATDRDGEDAETLHQCADQRLYEAKRSSPRESARRPAAA